MDLFPEFIPIVAANSRTTQPQKGKGQCMSSKFVFHENCRKSLNNTRIIWDSKLSTHPEKKNFFINGPSATCCFKPAVSFYVGYKSFVNRFAGMSLVLDSVRFPRGSLLHSPMQLFISTSVLHHPSHDSAQIQFLSSRSLHCTLLQYYLFSSYSKSYAILF